MRRTVQWIWEQPQTLIGWIVASLVGERSVPWFRRVIVKARKGIGVSLGRYIILSQIADHAMYHEYGHCRQSARLGPLYLVVVGVPSIVRAGIALLLARKWSPSRIRQWYYGGYPEAWADRLGGVER